MNALLSVFLVAMSLVASHVTAATSYSIDISQSDIFPNEWVTPVSWPPAVTVEETEDFDLDCPSLDDEGVQQYETSSTMMPTCISITTEGAAGTDYRTYSYKAFQEKYVELSNLITIQWTVQLVRCENYPEPDRSACEKGQADFWKSYDPDGVVNNVLARFVIGVETQGASAFTDVPGNHPHAEAIQYMKRWNIVQGYPDGTFKPDDTINRAEFTKILILDTYGEGAVNGCSMCLPFSDVDATAWYRPYVCRGFITRLIEGYPDGTFRPGDNVNVAEAAKIITWSWITRFSDETFEVHDGDPWYAGNVRLLAKHHAIPTSITRLDQHITRGEMAEIIYRLNAEVMNKPSRTYEEFAR